MKIPLFKHLLLASLICCLIVAGAIGQYVPLSTQTWNFGGNSYLNFDESVAFSDTPHLGINSTNLINYWNMNENTGNTTFDSGLNSNNGSIYGASWSPSFYNSGLTFNGVDNYVKTSNFTNPDNITICAWIKIFSLPTNYSDFILSHGSLGKPNGFRTWDFKIGADGRLCFEISTTGNNINDAYSSAPLSINNWYNCIGVYDGTKLQVYVNGTAGSPTSVSGNLSKYIRPLYIGRGTYLPSPDGWFNGIIDDVRIFNYSLSAPEIRSLHTQPDPSLLTNFFTFEDLSSHNVMLLKITPTVQDGNQSLVTCQSFFTAKTLSFRTNSSFISANIWTNLGKPIIIVNGIWNGDNSTVTLLFDNHANATLKWVADPPQVSKMSTNTSTTSANTLFSVLWSDNQSLSDGGYILSTNNTGQWINSTWVPFSSNPCWGNATVTLNSSANVTIGFREFANNTYNVWADSGFYFITTITESGINNSTNPNVTITPTPSVSNLPWLTPIPSPSNQTSQTPSPTISPAPSQSSAQIERSYTLLIESILLISSLIILVVIFIFAFIKRKIVFGKKATDLLRHENN